MTNDTNDEKVLKDKAKDVYVEGKKDVKDGLVDTKAAAEKAKNEVEAQAEKL